MRMRSNPKAQSLFEFVVLLSLAAAAIAFMYQPVRNSLFGYFKSLDESTYDSETEIQTKAPPNRGGIGNCFCTDYVAGACGGGANPPFTPLCQTGERLWTRTCPNCAPGMFQTRECRADSSCCSVPTPLCTGNIIPCCGANVSGFAPNGNYPGPNGDSCQDGYAKFSWRCGAQDHFACQIHAGCDFTCTNLPQNAQACTGDPNNQIRLFNSTPYTLVNPNQCGNTNIKCKARCNPGTRPNQANNSCDACPDPAINSTVPGWGTGNCICRGNHCKCGLTARTNETPTCPPGSGCWCDNGTIDLTATCPAGTRAETGYFYYQHSGSGAGGDVWSQGEVNIGPNAYGWRATGNTSHESGDSCHDQWVTSTAFCQPSAPCPRTVLIDLKHVWGSGPTGITCDALPNPPWYNGTARYKTVGVFYNVYYCALVDNFIPAASGPGCALINVAGDQLLIGTGVRNILNPPIPATVRPDNLWAFGCSTPPCCSDNWTYIQLPPSQRAMPLQFGCCPSAWTNPPGWRIQGHDRWDGYISCLRNERSFCRPIPFSSPCPQGSRAQRVITGAYMKHIPGACENNNSCTCINLPPGACNCQSGYQRYAGPGWPDQMIYCAVWNDICVEN